jgi:hypothetical protein
MFKAFAIFLLAASTFADANSSAKSAMLYFDTTGMFGSQVVPPNASPGIGNAFMALDDVTGALSVNVGDFELLEGIATSATLNDAPPGSNGPLITTFTITTPGLPAGNFTGGAVLNAGQISDLKAGDMYVVVSSSVFPSGEIRGQLTQVPEPNGLALAALGGVVLLVVRRRVRCASRRKFAA